MPNQKFLEFMCQHLLAIAWYQGQTNPEGQFNRPPECKLASAFLVHPVVDNFEFTLLATAAHIFTDYEKDTTKKGLTARSHVLFDAWGPKAKCGLPIPCNIFEEPRSFLDDLDTGRDYAFVQLFDFYHRPLSQTTTPFPRDVWAGADLDRFNQFFMVGLPAEVANVVTGSEGARHFFTVRPRPELLVLDRCEPPSDLTGSDSHQFVAQIVGRNDLADIRGMSGGPIIGVEDLGGGNHKYALVAMQSRWLPDRRIVAGTLMSEIARDIDNALRRKAS